LAVQNQKMTIGWKTDKRIKRFPSVYPLKHPLVIVWDEKLSDIAL